MNAKAWPSRSEWQAKAEYAVRTACTKWERLESDAVWSTPAEDAEMRTLGLAVAKALRPLLTAEIKRLRELFPDRPRKGRDRGLWMIELPEERYTQACDLGALEGMRTEIGRSAGAARWDRIAFEAGRMRKHHRAITLPAEVLAAVDRMNAITDTVADRRDREAQRLEDEAVAREIERRASDEGWAKELSRRARIESPRVIYAGAPQTSGAIAAGQTPPTEGDRVI